MTEWTLSSFHAKYYDPSRCAELVSDRGGRHSYQCSRKRGYGPEQAYCKQHDPVAVKAKREAQREKWWKERADQEAEVTRRRSIQNAKDAALEACRKIVDGHNDPRVLAADVLAMLPEDD